MKRGFTLVELLVALAIAATVLAAGELSVLRAAGAVRRTRELESMRRNGQGAMDALTRDLRAAGLGRPTGPRKSNGADRFPAAVLQASATSVTFLGDVARPGSALSGFSRLAGDLVTRPPTGLPLLNELNGNCDIRSGLVGFTPCDAAAASLVAPPGSAECRDHPDDAPTCPWALSKYQRGEYVVVQDGDGSWEEVQVDSLTLHQATSLGGLFSRDMLHLATPVLLVQAAGAWAATPDRLSYSLAGGRLLRSQCWASVGAPVATQLLAGCTGAQTTGYEALLAHVQALSLDYLDEAGASLLDPSHAVPVADLDRIARVTARATVVSPLGATAVFSTSVSLPRAP